METETFIADTAREALDRIRQRLGADARVLRVRRVPRKGWSGLFGGAQVEVTVQKPAMERPDATQHLALIRKELARRRPAEPGSVLEPEASPAAESPARNPSIPRGGALTPDSSSIEPKPEPEPGSELERTVLKSLEGMGLMPLYQHRLVDMLQRARPDWRSGGLPAALRAIAAILEEGWRPVKPLEALGRRHLFIGPAGVGKSALLGRRIVRAHLDEPESGFVAALDGTTVNSCPLLQYQCEALGIGFERSAPDAERVGEALLYYDTPGVDWLDRAAMDHWRDRLEELGRPSVHLVLNAAYDVATLTRQVRAFAPLGPTDVSFTHLDEVANPSKLWNVILGTGCLVRWLAGGQKIPGSLEEAEAIALLPSAMTADR